MVGAIRKQLYGVLTLDQRYDVMRFIHVMVEKRVYGPESLSYEKASEMVRKEFNEDSIAWILKYMKGSYQHCYKIVVEKVEKFVKEQKRKK